MQYVARGQGELQRVADVIRRLAPTKAWRIDLTPHRAKRSSEQNAYLWVLYTAIAKSTGHTPEEIHKALKRKFLPPVIVTIGDEEIAVPGSTTKLEPPEFSDYIERVQAWAASELGVVV